MTFNDYLWQVVNEAHWWFWAPFTFYAICGLTYIYRLAPAETSIGRTARVIQTMGFICMAFIPFFNGLGPYAFHCLAIAALLILKQIYDNCVRSGKIQPPQAATVVGRMAERIAEKPHG